MLRGCPAAQFAAPEHLTLVFVTGRITLSWQGPTAMALQHHSSSPEPKCDRFCSATDQWQRRENDLTGGMT